MTRKFANKPKAQPKNKPKEQDRSKASLYGYHAVEAAWLNPDRAVKGLYITENAAKNFEEALERGKTLNRPTPKIVERKDIDKLCPKEAVHQGIALVCDDLPELGVRDLLIKNRDEARALFVILDQITDPHNVGAILRSAVAFGAKGVIMQRRHSPELSGVLAKSASGALDHIDVALEVNLSRAIELFQEDFYTVYGLDERGETEIHQADMSDKAVLVMGAEGPGLRPKVKEHCDQLLRIPMTSALASINVSNAAAVSLFSWATVK